MAAYVVRLWRGEIGLPMTFWFWGFLVPLALRAIELSADAAASRYMLETSAPVPHYEFWNDVDIVVALAYSVFIWVAIWRATTKSTARVGRGIARLWVVLAVLTTAYLVAWQEFVLPNPSLRLILAKPDRLEVLSLDPYARSGDPHQGFHGFPVLKSFVVNDPNVRRKLVVAFETGIERGRVAFEALCFNPRHGMRAVRDGRIADFVICFECGSVETSLDGKWVTSLPITNYPAQTFAAVLGASSDTGPM